MKSLSKQKVICEICGTVRMMRLRKGRPPSKYCSQPCQRKGSAKTREVQEVEKTCPTCLKSFKTKPGYKTEYCSALCGQRSEKKRTLSSKRMRVSNPMKDESVRQAVSERMKGIDPFKDNRGGNGRGPTKAEKSLAEVGQFKMGHIVKTGHCRNGSGYPISYKLDLAWPSLKITVEVDGPSHQSLRVQEADRRKESFLRSKGWKVFRVSNEEALSQPENALARIKEACGFTI
jgi:hypothetical protein